VFREILLVTRQPEQYADKAIRIVEDIFEARSSLTGIHAGLTHAQADYLFVVACDAPFVQPALIRLLIDAIAPGVEAVVPFLNGYYEPLCAIYAKSCVAPIEDQLNRGDFKIIRFFERIRVQRVPEEKIRSADPRLLSFLNVNTPEAYLALQKMKDNWI
ncbi:MAG: molybdenum cofactor guanylyltransferase, partial [Desulfatitalea sp.]